VTDDAVVDHEDILAAGCAPRNAVAAFLDI
jgi:hypothetical protein